MNSYSHFKHLHAIHLSHRSTILQLNYIYKRYGLSSLVYFVQFGKRLTGVYVHLCVCVPDCSISYRAYILFSEHILQKHQMVAVKGWSMCASLSLFSARLFIIAFLLDINFVYIQKNLMKICYSGTLINFHAINNKLIY